MKHFADKTLVHDYPSNKILLKIFHCEMVLQLECSFYSLIVFQNTNFTLKMANYMIQKNDSKNVSSFLCQPKGPRSSSWVLGPETQRKVEGKSCNSFLTNWTDPGTLQIYTTHEEWSLLGSYREVQTGWIWQSMFIITRCYF